MRYFLKASGIVAAIAFAAIAPRRRARKYFHIRLSGRRERRDRAAWRSRGSFDSGRPS